MGLDALTVGRGDERVENRFFFIRENDSTRVVALDNLTQPAGRVELLLIGADFLRATAGKWENQFLHAISKWSSWAADAVTSRTVTVAKNQKVTH